MVYTECVREKTLINRFQRFDSDIWLVLIDFLKFNHFVWFVNFILIRFFFTFFIRILNLWINIMFLIRITHQNR